ncbi:hypothetical protein WMY93_018591 [Mugilogobius chulae]|uniref:Uncharacterized protein n=1 Tax=Mugilogobius chulae TaxID=88201 RepID=A0AAW0NVC3_9GOBI
MERRQKGRMKRGGVEREKIEREGEKRERMKLGQTTEFTPQVSTVQAPTSKDIFMILLWSTGFSYSSESAAAPPPPAASRPMFLEDPKEAINDSHLINTASRGAASKARERRGERSIIGLCGVIIRRGGSIWAYLCGHCWGTKTELTIRPVPLARRGGVVRELVVCVRDKMRQIQLLCVHGEKIIGFIKAHLYLNIYSVQ